MSTLSDGNIDKYEYLTKEETSPSDQSRIIEQAKFTYSPLGKTFDSKQTKKKKIKEQGENKLKLQKI